MMHNDRVDEARLNEGKKIIKKTIQVSEVGERAGV